MEKQIRKRPGTQIESKIEDYLARIEPARRDYARQYMQWVNGTGCGEPPKRSGVSAQSAKIMRSRIELMLQGESIHPALRYRIY